MTTTPQAVDTTTTTMMGGAYDFGGEFINHMWFEIMVFLITSVLALSMRGLGRGVSGNKKTVNKWKLAEYNDSPSMPAGANRDRRPAPVGARNGKSPTQNSQQQTMEGSGTRRPQFANNPKGAPAATKVQGPGGPVSDPLGILTQGGSNWRVTKACANLPRCVDMICEIGTGRNQNAGSPGFALEVFEELNRTDGCARLKEMPPTPEGNDAARFYTAVFQCAIRVRQPKIGLDVVETMRRTDVPRSRVFYETAMKILAGKKYHQEALDMYEHMVAEKLEPSAVTMSCLVSFAVEIGDLEKAVKFFEKLQKVETPSIRAYMTILRVYAKRLDVAKSTEIVLGMEKKGIKPDALILNIVLGTCVSAGKASEAEALLEQFLVRDNSIVDVISYNTVVKGYAQAGEFGRAIAILEKMSDRIPPVTPNLITFNTIMDAAVRAKQTDEAWKVLAEMRRQGLTPDKYSCSILVKGLVQNGEGSSTPPSREQIQNSLKLVSQLGQADSSKLHTMLFHSLLDASAQLNDWKLMLRVFEQMKGQKVPPTSTTFGNMMKCLSKASQPKELAQVWEEMLLCGIEPNPITLSILLDGLISSCNELELAETVFDRLPAYCKTELLYNVLVRFLCKAKEPERALKRHAELNKMSRDHARGGAAAPGLEPMTSGVESGTYIVLIRTLSEVGNLQRALSVFEDMVQSGQKVDESIYLTLLNTCQKDGPGCENADLTKRLFDDMVARGVKPSGATFSILIKVFGRAKRLDEAFDVLEKMRSSFGLEPSMLTYTCLMQACVRNRQTLKALELFSQMKQRGSANLAPDQVTYGTLISGCAFANFISQGVDLLEQALQDKVEVQADSLNNLITAALRKKMVSDNHLVNQKLYDLLMKNSQLPIQEKLKERLAKLQEGPEA